VSIRTLATLAVAIFLGLVAVILVRVYLGATAPRVGVQTATGTVPVVVAVKALPRGTVLQADMLKVVTYPNDAAPAGAYRDVAAAVSGPEQQRILLRSVVANESLLSTNVSGAGNRMGLAGALTPGMRAVSVRSNDVAGVGGFVLPGDRVDVLLTRSVGSGGGQDKKVMQVLAENVRVLGVDQTASVEEQKPVVAKSVTVEVTPEEANAISLGQAVGTVALSLRQLADETPLAQKFMSEADLAALGRGRVRATGGSGIRVIHGIQSAGR
jgi:pilus assembly protein CpaB